MGGAPDGPDIDPNGSPELPEVVEAAGVRILFLLVSPPPTIVENGDIASPVEADGADGADSGAGCSRPSPSGFCVHLTELLSRIYTALSTFRAAAASLFLSDMVSNRSMAHWKCWSAVDTYSTFSLGNNMNMLAMSTTASNVPKNNVNLL